MPLLTHNFHGYPKNYSHITDEVIHFMSVKIGNSEEQKQTIMPEREEKNDLKLKKSLKMISLL